MSYDIVIGRSKSDFDKFQNEGTVFIGKTYVKMGREVSLSNNLFLDVARSHVVLICGKRGSGKSYTMGAIAEGIIDLPENIRQNLSFVILDTMGVYWTMKHANQKDEDMLAKWNLEPKGLNVNIYTPHSYFKKYQDEGMPTDYSFGIRPSELMGVDWCNVFDIPEHSDAGVLVKNVIHRCKKELKVYEIQDVIKAVNLADFDQDVKRIAVNLFMEAQSWGLFNSNAESLKNIAKPGEVSIIDVSCYATLPGGWNVKSLVIGLIAEKLFEDRMKSRKFEELEMVQRGFDYFKTQEELTSKEKMPLVWLVIDEAHEFLPSKGTTPALAALKTILREGRQPGISLILATQQPGKIHSDVITQSDIVISHRITAKKDIDALGEVMQSYMGQGLVDVVNNLPREPGAAVLLDDTSERIIPMRIRPRITWHGGEAPSAVHKIKRGAGLDF